MAGGNEVRNGWRVSMEGSRNHVFLDGGLIGIVYFVVKNLVLWIKPESVDYSEKTTWGVGVLEYWKNDMQP